MNKDGKWAYAAFDDLFAPLVMVTGLFRRLAAIHRTGFESQCARLPAFLAQYSVHSRCARYSLMRDEVGRAHKLRHLDFSTLNNTCTDSARFFSVRKTRYERR